MDSDYPFGIFIPVLLIHFDNIVLLHALVLLSKADCFFYKLCNSVTQFLICTYFHWHEGTVVVVIV